MKIGKTCTFESTAFGGDLVIYKSEVVDGEKHWLVKAPRALKPNSAGMNNGDISVMCAAACDMSRGIFGVEAIDAEAGEFRVIFDSLPSKSRSNVKMFDIFKLFMQAFEDRVAHLPKTEDEYIAHLAGGMALHSTADSHGFSS